MTVAFYKVVASFVVTAATCPDGMDYYFKTTACVATCERPNAPEECSLPQVENCVCRDPDQVVIDGECKDAQLCGCVDDNDFQHAVSASQVTWPTPCHVVTAPFYNIRDWHL